MERWVCQLEVVGFSAPWFYHLPIWLFYFLVRTIAYPNKDKNNIIYFSHVNQLCTAFCFAQYVARSTLGIILGSSIRHFDKKTIWAIRDFLAVLVLLIGESIYIEPRVYSL